MEVISNSFRPTDLLDFWFYRLRFFILFVVFCSISSCSKVDIVNENTHRVDLAIVHNDILAKMSSLDKNIEYSDEYFNRFYATMEKVNSEGLSHFTSLDKSYNKIFDALDFYYFHKGKENVYGLINDNFEFNSDEAYKLILIIEIEKQLSSQINRNFGTRGSGFYCGVAVAATIVHTLSAVTIVTPVGLGFWLVGKALATAGVIGSCQK